MTTLQMATPVAAQVIDTRQLQEGALERVGSPGARQPIGITQRRMRIAFEGTDSIALVCVMISRGSIDVPDVQLRTVAEGRV